MNYMCNEILKDQIKKAKKYYDTFPQSEKDYYTNQRMKQS